MENLLSKNWKKLFIVIGAIALAFLLFYKITWKPNIINDYLKSDINVKSDVIDSVKGKSTEIQKNNENAMLLDNNTDESKGSRSIVGWVAIFVIVLIAILLLDSYMQGSSSSSTKKK